MARLRSINLKDFFILKPLYFENKSEDWITSQIILFQNGKNIAKVNEPLFQLNEIEALIVGINELLDKKTKKVSSSFLEPNLLIKLEEFEQQTYLIDIICRLFIDVENGEIQDTDESSKRLKFSTTRREVITFIDNLKHELSNLNRS